MTDNPLKIVSVRPDVLTVANYILPGSNGRDLAHTETPVTLRGLPVGLVDWSTAKADDIGLWVQRVLARRNRYVKMLEELLERGLVTTQPICEAGKAAGQVVVCRDILVTPASAAKASGWDVSVMARALGLLGQDTEKAQALARLRLKLKMLATGG